jgi:ABC-type sugar transport system ATPase subunit
MASILLDAVSVEISGTEILHRVSLSVADGEFLVVVGPSGSGKTTLLRTVAGLDTPSGGDVLFDGAVVTDLPPYQRDVAMVFQTNALLPFRSARRNVSFPLEIHGVPRDEIDRRVDAEARVMAIESLLERYPSRLSAGHRQLVQAARALVRRPSVFLLDEPLALVDAVARQEMRNEIRLLQQGYGVTTLYATNDPHDAMVLADRVVVLDAGMIRQVGAPLDVYGAPVDTFVAGFFGTPPMSFLPGVADEREVRIGSGALPLPHGLPRGPVTVGVRAEDWEQAGAAGLLGTVRTVENHGDHAFVTIDLAGDAITMRVDDRVPVRGETVEIWARRFLVFGADGRRIAVVGHDRPGH